MRLSYLPPLLVYAAFGVSGLTGIVGAFFVKDYLDVSAAFLAALGFWAGIPWALKMPVGHLVDLIWRWKSALVWLGAGMIAAGLLIMIGLISHREAMSAVMSAGTADQTKATRPACPMPSTSTGSNPDNPKTEASAMTITSASAAKNGPASA